MWLLRCENDERVFYVGKKSEVIVGRSFDVCDLTLSDDASVSRKHVKILVQGRSLKCQDLGSKYGTFINGGIDTKIPLGKGVNVEIFHLDKIRFGLMSNVWIVEKISLVTCISTLKGDSLQTLKSDVQDMGAELKNVWSEDCSHLTMPAITLTPKVVLALANSSYIVTPHFWKACKEAIQNGKPLPDSKKFLPDVHEVSLNREKISFEPNAKRKNLFLDQKFIFFSRRQMNSYKDILVAAGGAFALLSESKMTKSKLCHDNIIVVHYSGDNFSQNTQAQQAQINDIVNYLKNKSKRVIPESEIGLSILYSSTDKYCNPDFNFSTEILRKQSTALNPMSQNANFENVLAIGTEDMFLPTPDKEEPEKIIEETLISNTTLETRDQENKDLTNVCIDRQLNMKTKRKYSLETDFSKDGHHLKKRAKVEEISDEYDEMFAFIEEDPTPKVSTRTPQQIEQPKKKLNILAKPTRNKKYLDEDEDNMFNFLEPIEKPKPTTSTASSSSYSLTNKPNVLSAVISKRPCIEAELPASKKLRLSEIRNVSAHSVLKKSAITDSIWKSSDADLNKIKKEIADSDEDIENRLKEMDIKEALVVSRSDLIVRDTSYTKLNDSSLDVTTGRNFKKFRKVMPLKVHTMTIPKSAMAVHKVVNKRETVDLLNSMCNPYDSNDEDRVDNMRLLRRGKGKRSR